LVLTALRGGCEFSLCLAAAIFELVDVSEVDELDAFLESEPTLTIDKETKLDRFFSSFVDGASPVLLLDYDGTLASFRVNRFVAKPWAGVRQLLERIQRQGRTRVAIITGRPASEIEPLLELDAPVEVWGLHGAERLYPDGRRVLETAPAAARKKLDQLREMLLNDSLGGRFEDKPNAVVMHWRGAAARKARLIEKKTRQLFEPAAQMDGLGLLEFESGLELRVGRDKGGAVEAILEEAGTSGPTAFLGDDLTDEAAFRAVNTAGARSLSALVRREYRETDAEIWLRPPADVRAFLARWAQAVER
jgi:trehalose-phosphatase